MSECKHEKTHVANTRPKDGGRYRRYHCECGYKFSTFEIEIPTGSGHGSFVDRVKENFRCNREKINQIKALIDEL